MTEPKKKILFLSDMQVIPSGVGNQAKLLIEGLLATGKYKFYCLGGAIEHPNYDLMKVDPNKWGDDWIIQPVKGHGSKQIVREVLAREKPDALFMFTDPRFFVWLWEMEDEIHRQCPILYWHVWDNDPTPDFNMPFYESTDFVSALSLKTYGLLKSLGYKSCNYIPHAVKGDVFKQVPEEEALAFKRKTFGPHGNKKFVLFWNNRNARRKMTGDVLDSFARFANRVGKEHVSLAMHTAVHDPEGQDIVAVAKKFDIERQLLISEQRVQPEELNMFYNACDATINIAQAEGFGLGTLESLCSGTPIIAHMTGGLQFQLGDWWEQLKNFENQEAMTALAKKRWEMRLGKWWGVPVFPSTRSCTGSQEIPYIYDDRVDHADVVDGLVELYEMGREKRRALGAQAREWALQRFDISKMVSEWDKTFEKNIEVYKQYGPRPTFRMTDI